MPTVRIRNGHAVFVYSDDLHRRLSRYGKVTISRASSIEFDHVAHGWIADLTPTIPGCVLGPFVSRTEAVAAEVARLEEALHGS